MAFTPPPWLGLCGLNMQGDIGGFTTYVSQRRQLVVFPKSPPKTKPSPAQVHARNAFRAAGESWGCLSDYTKNVFKDFVKRTGAYGGGFVIWLIYTLKLNLEILKLIERIVGRDIFPQA
jgi:hypothetical protein